jgi:hypothetical protein
MWETAWQITGFTEMMRMLYTNPTRADRIIDGVDRIRLLLLSVLTWHLSCNNLPVSSS